MKYKLVIQKERGKIRLKKGWQVKNPSMRNKTLQDWQKFTKEWSAWGPRSVVATGYRPMVYAIYGDLHLQYSVAPKLFRSAKEAERYGKKMLDAAGSY